MSVVSLYTARATATGNGRNGHVRTDDGLIAVDLRLPVEMGGAGGATNPEQLFAAGYAACLHNALRLVASRQKVRLGDDTSITAEVSITRTTTGGYQLAVALKMSLPGQDPVQAEKMVTAAHTVCPYSTAIHGNVEVSSTITV
jgi:osmotically inducible protein OsmC